MGQKKTRQGQKPRKVLLNPKFKAAPAVPAPAAAEAEPLLGELEATRLQLAHLGPPSRFGPWPLTPTQEDDLLALLEKFLTEYDAAEQDGAAAADMPKFPLKSSRDASRDEKTAVSKLLKLGNKGARRVWAANAVRALKTRVAART